jgi:predicted aspartyl protease
MRALLCILVGLTVMLSGMAVSGQTKGIVEVPFEFIKNEPVVRVTINGRGPLNMMMDTGTDPSAIDLATATSIGLNRSSKGQAASGSGTEKNLAYECKFATVEIGGLTATNVAAAAIDISKVSERMGVKIDGVLGYSLFRKRIVQFDYPARVLRFYEVMPAAKDANAVVMKFRYENNVLIDNVKINDIPVVANLDTGASSAFTISPKGIERLGLAEAAANGTVKLSVGYNGRSESREGTVRSIQIGSISVESPTVLFGSKGNGHDNSPWSINIGNPFLKDYIVTFDYQTKTVRFEKPAGP